MNCRRCGGTGKEPDPVQIGQKMRDERLRRGLSLREMASRLGFTASYICDLELGRRGWSARLRDAYKKGLA